MSSTERESWPMGPQLQFRHRHPPRQTADYSAECRPLPRAPRAPRARACRNARDVKLNGVDGRRRAAPQPRDWFRRAARALATRHSAGVSRSANGGRPARTWRAHPWKTRPRNEVNYPTPLGGILPPGHIKENPPHQEPQARILEDEKQKPTDPPQAKKSRTLREKDDQKTNGKPHKRGRHTQEGRAPAKGRRGPHTV